MAQDPLKVDQLQIEPGAAGTRLLDRDPATGAMRLQDAVTSAITLGQLAGLRNIANVFIVGKSGAGAPYTTIQSALDDVPAAASPSNPYIVLVMPGDYSETVNLVRDGVKLIGLGQPRIIDPLYATPNAVGNDHTVILSSQLGTTPELCHIEGFTILNAHNNKAPLRIVGAAASTLGGNDGGVYITNCTLQDDSPGGGRPIWSSTVNAVTLTNCNLMGGVSSQVVVEENSLFRMVGGSCSMAMSLRWDTGQDLPADAAQSFTLEGVHNLGLNTALVPALAIDLDGGGAAQLKGMSMPLAKRLQVSGDQAVEVTGSTLGVVSVLETATLGLWNSSYASVLAANANAIFDAPVRGTAAFVAAATVAVSFDIPQTDNGYRVDLELDARPANDEVAWITNKLATGFTINFNTAQTLNVGWRTTRN